MKLTGTYIFPAQFQDAEFTDPTITGIPRSGIRMHDNQTMIDATVYMQGDGYKIGVNLTDIPVMDFNYDEGQALDRVLARLKDFKKNGTSI